MRLGSRRRLGFGFLTLAVAGLALGLFAGCRFSRPEVGRNGGGEAPPERFRPRGQGVELSVWTRDLEVPWSLVFLTDKRALVSERSGRVRLIEAGELQEEPYLELDVADIGEGGLMGLAVHPNFPEKPYVYAMHTYEEQGELLNKVIRFEDKGQRGVFDSVVIDKIPGGSNHDGGRIAFGPDKMLYIATGDAGTREIAQDLQSLGGKILRLTPNGDIPDDNPFKNSAVYSYGHRNPQGLAWHPETGDLFQSEHGPSGEAGRFAHDEINVIEKGKNYGWPEVIGKVERASFVDPLVVWPDKAVPPGGIVFWKSDLFVATLGSEALIKMTIKETNGQYEAAAIERWFADEGSSTFGRIRDVVVGPDEALYFLTSNQDGRGRPRAGDDKIYRVAPK